MMDFNTCNRELNRVLNNIDCYEYNWFEIIVNLCYIYGDLGSIENVKDNIYSFVSEIDDNYSVEKHRSNLNNVNLQYKFFYCGFNDCYISYFIDGVLIYEISKRMAFKKINDEFYKLHMRKKNEIKHYITSISPISDLENTIFSFINVEHVPISLTYVS